MSEVNHPYERYLAEGNAWSPDWDDRQSPDWDIDNIHFSWRLVLTPPGVTKIRSEHDYYDLLIAKLEWHIWVWINEYSSEMPYDGKDWDDPINVKSATISMIRRLLPIGYWGDITVNDDLRTIAKNIVDYVAGSYSHLLFPRGQPFFPVDVLSDPDANRDFAYSIQQEELLDHWLRNIGD